MEFGIIGGTGVTFPEILGPAKEKIVQTTYGKVKFKFEQYKEKEIYFLARHGDECKVLPHEVNYRANIAAIRDLGVKSVYATAAVGSLNLRLKPGDLVLIDQFIDFTKSRVSTFGKPECVKGESLHIDMTEPYCSRLRGYVEKAAKGLELNIHKKATYVCTEGPRFETSAEIMMFRKFGGDVVGMTGVPEVVLAREVGLCYATIALVTNYAAGISPTPLTHREVEKVMQENAEKLQKLLMKSIEIAKDLECGYCGRK